MTRYQKSVALYDRACKVTPGGSQTLSKAPARFPLGAYPAYIERGEGPYVWDVDGNRYFDLIGGLGALAVGHAHPRVVEAVTKQVRDGAIFSLPHRLEVDVSERFCASVPCAKDNGMVRWTKTGSEACAAAVRIARAHTKRDLILTPVSSYHGWHDWYGVIKPQHPGVPDFMYLGIATFAPNDIEGLMSKLKHHEGHVAAVMLEPALMCDPPEGYLQTVVDAAHSYGALAIFDEMILCGRLAWAGGQEYYGVTPDLGTFGKAIGGGLPIACVCGRVELMQHAWSVSGTFGGDALGLAAVNAVMDIYRDEPIIQRQQVYGTAIQDWAKAHLSRLSIQGIAPRPILSIKDDVDMQMTSLWLQETAKRGVLLHPSGGINVPGVMSCHEFVENLRALSSALIALRGDPQLEGDRCQPWSSEATRVSFKN